MSMIILLSTVILVAVEDNLVLESSRGDVAFTHKVHEGYADGDCGECHHKSPDNPQSCSGGNCHGDDDRGDVPTRKDALHSNCKDSCHRAEDGPTRCNGCHS